MFWNLFFGCFHDSCVCVSACLVICA